MTQSSMENLIQKYKNKLPDIFFHLRTLVVKLQNTPNIDTLKDIIAIVHKLAGSAGTFGMLEISLLCKKEEKHLQKYMHTIATKEASLSLFNDLFHFISQLEQIHSGEETR